ncbi:MmyB family transcriptional regulator [Streptomyces antimycoticus]|uniref:MmyB family transcriptional regulator n=1 Tax=Streptomyces antimycoticus TaxID=68175 RepID=UPI00256FFE56|nr:hypothetical protein [Streptomyces antimycoticus]WJE01619.1 hypothetical protein QR300_39975 [Streptomyces antimycoticus]
MDRVLLADFLRARREALQPEDVGLPCGSRGRTGGLRREEVAALAGVSVVAALLEASPEFAELWRSHEVDVTHHEDLKRYRHRELGELELYCQRLVDPDQAQELLVCSAVPGSPSYEKLQLLAAVDV